MIGDPQHADVQRTRLEQGVLLHQLGELLRLTHDPPGVDQELLPGVAEADRPGVANEQGDAQLLFQIDDLLGEGGLGEVEVFGGGGDAARLRHLDKIA